jgi:hypothetical protein
MHAPHPLHCSDGDTPVNILNAIENCSREEALLSVPVPRPKR